LILPTKHITSKDSLLGIGSDMISLLNEPMTVSSLWVSFKQKHNRTNRIFYHTLYLLYIIGLVDFKNGKILKVAEQ